jgi:hypothetical protein
MQDAKLIKVIAEYLAKCAEIHARGESIPPESLEGFTIDIVSCLDVIDIGDIGKELIPLKRARAIIRLQGANLSGSATTWSIHRTGKPACGMQLQEMYKTFQEPA